MKKRQVLILCTGNSCRSQMAEGIINHFFGNEWQAFSAGTEPAGYVHALAIDVMAELGIDISKGESKYADRFRDQQLDLVITVCAGAAESCPSWWGPGEVVHIGFDDPATATGSHQEKMVIFRRVRDEIREGVLGYLHALTTAKLHRDEVLDA